MFIRDVRRLGRWFPEKVAFWIILEHQIFRFAKMILRDRCSTSYDLASLSRGRRSTLHRWRGKSQNALVRGRQLCTQLSMFEGSVNRFVFDVVQVQNWGSLAKLLRFGCCQVQVVQGPKFEHFWLANVLCATTACILSTAELQQVLRTWCVLYILTSKCASRHNGVQFFISRLAKWLRTRRFRELTFQNIGKTKWLATFLPFRTPASTFFWLFLFFLLPFSSLTLLTSAFPSVHIVGSLTSKLPPRNKTELVQNQWRFVKVSAAHRNHTAVLDHTVFPGHQIIFIVS